MTEKQKSRWIFLKPCPFCGSGANWEKDASRASFDDASCSNGKCSFSFLPVKAAEWNTRATIPNKADELAETLREKKLNAEFWMRTDAVQNEAYYQGRRDAFDEIIKALTAAKQGE